MPDMSSVGMDTLRVSSPKRPKSALLRSPERKMRIENGGEGGRRGNTEEQYGQVSWAGTLRQKTWDDKLNRYVGLNPAAELGEDWRQPEKKRRPQSAMTLGTRGLSGGHGMTGVAAPHMWESSQWQAANSELLPQPERVHRPSSGFSRRSTMDPASDVWSAKHTIGHRRPSTAGRVQHVSTVPMDRFDQWDLTHRPRTSTTIDSRSHFSSSQKTRTSRRSTSSSGSSASTMSFLDTYSTADKKTQRLLMMQKKMQLSDAMTKKAQVQMAQSGRPCTPEMVEALGNAMTRELDGTVRRDTLDSAFQQSVMGESANDLTANGEEQIDHNVLNHDGGFSFGEVVYGTHELDGQVEKITRKLAMDGTLPPSMASSGGFRTVARGSDFDGGSSRRSGSKKSGSWGQTSSLDSINTPWRGKGDANAKEGANRAKMRQSGSLVMGMYDTLKEGTSRAQLTHLLQACVSTGPLDEGCCSFLDFQNTLYQLSISLSRMEMRWFKKEFKGHTNVNESFNYRLFFDTFWPYSEAHAEAISGAKQDAAMAFLISSLRAAILKYVVDSGSGIPPAVTMLTKFQQYDGIKCGVVRAQAVADTLQAFDIDANGVLGENGLYLLGLKFGRDGDVEQIEYSELINGLLPPQLTMPVGPQRLSVTAEPTGGITGESAGGSGVGVAKTFYDVVKKIKEETNGNRAVLEQCFKLQDPENSGTISPDKLSQALLLLRIDLGRKAITTCFGLFHCSHDLIDYRKLLNEVFPAGESLQEHDAIKESMVHDLEQEIYHRCKDQFPTLLVAFRELTGKDNSMSRKDLGMALRDRFHMQPDAGTLDALWSHWDADGSDCISFDEFAAIFRPTKANATLLKSKNVKAVKQMVREAIDARLDGSGGGGLLKAFHFFDRDRSGCLSYEEMIAGLNNYTGLTLDEGMCARLMDEYDPEGEGSVDFKGFARHVMGSDRGENLSFNNEFVASSASLAASTWSLPQLEAAIKKKMEKSWTQMHSDLKTADLDASGTLSKVELRGLLAKFAFTLDDKTFNDLCQKFPITPDGEIMIDGFMQYFSKLDGMEGLQMSPNMKIEAAQKFIAEKIEDRLEPGNGWLLRGYQLFDRDRSGHIDYDEFEHILQELCMIRLHPSMKKKLMKLYDPSGQGFIDLFGFTRFVMGSAPGAGTSYGNEEPKDPQRNDTLIHKKWDFEAVEGCLRRRLVGERGRKTIEALNSCDLERDGCVHMEELHSILDEQRLDMTAAQWKEFIRNFELTPDKRLRIDEFVDQFVTRDEDVDDGQGDKHWKTRSVDEIKSVIEHRVYNRIGAGPQEGYRTWKYFNDSTNKSAHIDVNTLRAKLKKNLNMDLSVELCTQLAEDYSAGDESGHIDFNEFVQRVLNSQNHEAKSLIPMEHVAAAVTHSGGNSDMFIRNKIRSSFRALFKAFKVADKDESGSLGAQELRSVLHRFSIDLTPTQFTELMKNLDVDGDGNVSYLEFMAYFQKKEAPNQRVSLAKHTVSDAVAVMLEKLNMKFSGQYASDNLRKAFTLADRDQSGTLSLDELTRALAFATGLEPEPEHVLALVRHYGIDPMHDVDYNEFTTKMMTGGVGISTGLNTRRISTFHEERPSSASSSVVAAVDVSRILQLIADKVMQRSENMRVVFRSFDEDKSGTISYQEFRRALAGLNVQLSGHEFDALCKHLDGDESGEIEYKEFGDQLGANQGQERGSAMAALTHDRPHSAGSAGSSVFSSHSDERPGTASSNRSDTRRPSSRSSMRGKHGKQLAAMSSKSMSDLVGKYSVQ